jgi:hypothetical protein
MTIDERLEALAQSVELLRSRVEHPQPDQVAVVTIATPPHSSASAVAGARACRRDLRRALSSPTPRFRHQSHHVELAWKPVARTVNVNAAPPAAALAGWVFRRQPTSVY